jgi:hypothetical protein
MTANWNYCYKIVDGDLHPTNMLYTPLTNDVGDTLWMKWDSKDSYQFRNTNLTDELIDFFIEREIKYLKIFQDYPWAPKIQKIDNKNIYIDWNKNTLNHILFTPGRNLNIECPDWKDQIFNILKDILYAGYYKMSLYPHCFFLDNGKIKTFDFYACIEKENPFIERKVIQGMIGENSFERFDNSTTNGVINFEKFFEITLIEHLSKTWPDNPFPEFYRRLINDIR